VIKTKGKRKTFDDSVISIHFYFHKNDSFHTCFPFLISSWIPDRTLRGLPPPACLKAPRHSLQLPSRVCLCRSTRCSLSIRCRSLIRCLLSSRITLSRPRRIRTWASRTGRTCRGFPRRLTTCMERQPLRSCRTRLSVATRHHT